MGLASKLCVCSGIATLQKDGSILAKMHSATEPKLVLKAADFWRDSKRGGLAERKCPQGWRDPVQSHRQSTYASEGETSAKSQSRAAQGKDWYGMQDRKLQDSYIIASLCS